MNIVETAIEKDPGCFQIAEIRVNNSSWMYLYSNQHINTFLNAKVLLFGMPVFPELHTELGWMECITDFATANGFQKIIGPLEGNTWNDYRFGYTSDKALFLTDVSNHHSFVEGLLNSGFLPKFHYFSSKLTSKEIKSPFITGRSFFENELQVEELDKEDILKLLPDLYSPVCNIFSDNLFYSPLSKDNFYSKYQKLVEILLPGDLFLVRDKQDIVGFCLSLRDLLNPHQNGMIVKTIGRISDKKYAGLGAWISEIIYKKFVSSNYEYMIHAFMHEDNNSLRISKFYQGEIIKKYAIYEKDI
ncbi:MAG: hypothetical protein KG003_10345 [Bacteroidetes bacterium]|nr:hypothetical protein [Bacteroidota bacterium]